MSSRGRPRLVAEGTPIYGPGSTGDKNDSPMQVSKPHVIGQKQENGDSVPKKRSSLQEASAALASSYTSHVSDSRGGRRGSHSSSLQEAAATVRASGINSPRHYTPKARKKAAPLVATFVIGGGNHTDDNSPSDNDGHDAMEGIEVHPPHQPPFEHTEDMDHEVIVEPHAYSASYKVGPHAHSTSYVVGGGSSIANGIGNSNQTDGHTKMEGVIDQSQKVPLVVLDGANVAYAYATALVNLHRNGGSLQAAAANTTAKVQPDPMGIQVAANYFLSAELRVLVVLPAPWFRSKPRPDDANRGNAKMETESFDILQGLKAKGLLVESPPADDDDAYALTIAQREYARSHQRHGEGTGYVLSNDMFRDAMDRDQSGNLRQWLTKGGAGTSISKELAKIHGPGRIGFTFADMGTMDDHGDRVLDFVPNPRHPLVAWVEQHHRSNSTLHG